MVVVVVVVVDVDVVVGVVVAAVTTTSTTRATIFSLDNTWAHPWNHKAHSISSLPLKAYQKTDMWFSKVCQTRPKRQIQRLSEATGAVTVAHGLHIDIMGSKQKHVCTWDSFPCLGLDYILFYINLLCIYNFELYIYICVSYILFFSISRYQRMNTDQMACCKCSLWCSLFASISMHFNNYTWNTKPPHAYIVSNLMKIIQRNCMIGWDHRATKAKKYTYASYDSSDSADVDDSSWCSLGFSNSKVMVALMKMCLLYYLYIDLY